MKFILLAVMAITMSSCSAGMYVNKQGAGVYVAKDDVTCWMVQGAEELE